MAAEIIAAVNVCASAYRFMKTAVQEGKDLNDMGRAIGKFSMLEKRLAYLSSKPQIVVQYRSCLAANL